jgi:lipoprotein-releasing system permease protein
MTRLPFELFLGLRYLKPKRTYVSVISLISLAGVAIGVWVLIVVIAVMSGFDRELREKIMGMNAHVTVAAAGGAVIEDPDEILDIVTRAPRVESAAPYVLGLVMVEFDQRIATPYVKGIDVRHHAAVTKLAHYLKVGKLDLDGEKVVIGKELAAQYGIFVGDRISVLSPKHFAHRDEVTLPTELTVTGIFESGMFEYDMALIFVSLETAQDLYGLVHGIHGVEAVTDDPLRGALEAKRALNAVLPANLRAQTWMDLNQRLLDALQVEKTVMFFILTFIVLVAAFGIMSTLITVTVQKTREIGVLKALGAPPQKILRIFLLQGFVVGVIGTGIGVALGLATIPNIDSINKFLSRVIGLELFPREIYSFPQIPALLTGQDLAVIAISALILCTLAGLFPAWRAARLEPVEALRHE